MIRFIIKNFAFFFALFSTPLSACEVSPNYTTPSIMQRAHEASHIMEGTVLFSEHDKNKRFIESVEINVTRWLKGAGPNKITIHGFGWGPDCKNSAPKSSSIFFTKEIESGSYSLNYLGVQDAVIDSEPSNIIQIQKALNL